MCFIEDKNEAVAFFVQPQDIYASDEDSADNDGGKIIVNITRNQLTTPAKAMLSDERQIENSYCNKEKEKGREKFITAAEKIVTVCR